MKHWFGGRVEIENLIDMRVKQVEKNRVCIWDNLKYILIFLVVLGHMVDQYEDSELYQSIYVFAYAFHMPVFIFISGMFHKNERIAQKVFTFIALGFIYKFLLFSVRSFMHEEVELKFLRESGAPWFMFALATFILLSYLLKDVNQGFVLIVFILMACFAGYDNKVDSKYVLSRILYFYPFFIAGNMVKRERLETLARKKILKFLGFCILLLWFFICIWKREHYYGMLDIFMGQKVVDEELFRGQCFVRLECYLITLLTGFSIILLTPTGRIPFFTKFGGRTLQIYFWHRPILYVLFDLGWITMFCETMGGRILYALSAIPVTFLLALKPFGFPTSQIMWFGKEQPLSKEREVAQINDRENNSEIEEES